MPSSNTDLASAALKTSLDKLKSTGANYVSFIIPYYQADTNSTVINRGGNTPTDAALISAITYAHSIGLKVSLKIHAETHDHGWRANINPTDRTAWFTSYGNILKHYATLAKNNNVEQIVIGTELIKMASDRENPTNTANWKKMIADMRAIYSGKLTYGANWGDGGGFAEEVNQIKFWDKLDYIGVSAYYWLAPNDPGVATVENLSASWEDWDNRKLKVVSDQWNKPILFTEIGYRSITGAHNHPWNWWDAGVYDETEQANDYTALFSYWNSKDYMTGVFLWSWEINPPAAGSNERGYTPQNKLAENVMRDWFTNPPSPSPVNPTFEVSTQVATTSVNTLTDISFKVKNTTNQAVNVLVNFEIHTPNYQKTYQEFFPSQHFAAGEEKTFNIKWTPRVEGNHEIMVGIFKNDWSENYLWNDKAGIIRVGDVGTGGGDNGDGSGGTGGGALPQCQDGLDNDKDGFYDMFDTGCSDSRDNDESGGTNGGGALPQCQDGKDNDGDNKYDMFDTGCTDSRDNDELT